MFGLRMTWEKLAFFHWRASSDLVARHLPRGVELDTYEGDAWVGIVPFLMTGVRVGPAPVPFGARRFLELNVRTYIVDNGVPSVWFFSLDASNPMAVRGARRLYHLPYFDAALQVSEGPSIEYSGKRIHKDAPPGAWRCSYRPQGPVFRSESGSFAHWATERYRLVAADPKGRLVRGDVFHQPWPLQEAEGSIEHNSLAQGWGLQLGTDAESILYAESLPVIAGWPRYGQGGAIHRI